jgi:hypothetical protein
MYRDYRGLRGTMPQYADQIGAETFDFNGLGVLQRKRLSEGPNRLQTASSGYSGL